MRRSFATWPPGETTRKEVGGDSVFALFMHLMRLASHAMVYAQSQSKTLKHVDFMEPVPLNPLTQDWANMQSSFAVFFPCFILQVGSSNCICSVSLV